MHERQRMQYLEAMGIDSFVPRFVLPHSKALVQCVLPSAPQESHMQTSQAHTSPAVEGSAGTQTLSSAVDKTQDSVHASKPQGLTAADEVVSNILTRTEDSAKTKKVTAENASRIAEEKTLEPTQAVDQKQGQKHGQQQMAAFSLSLWSVGETIQVVDSRSLGEALPTHKLLHSIVNGMQFFHGNLAGAEILNWPFIGAQDTSWVAAQHMVQGFLEGKLAAKPVQTIFLMGPTAVRTILGDEKSFDELVYSLVDLPSFSAKAIILPSLADILLDASLKRPVWLALKQLQVKL